MTDSSPGFVGARLKQAREARSMTAKDLAARVGVAATSLSHYETGRFTPTPQTVATICDVLRIRPSLLFREYLPRVHDSEIFFRSRAAATKRARTSALRRFEWLQEIVTSLSARVRFPSVDIPDLQITAPEQMRAEDIERSAQEVRKYWGFGNGPLSDAVLLLENKGCLVSRTDLHADTLDAFSAWIDGRPVVMMNSAKLSAARARLDAAHELAHLVLHRSVRDTWDVALLEKQAFQFAGAFLVPADSFAQALRSCSLNSFELLKPDWKVSIGMMIKRARTLELISGEEERRLWVSYSKRGYRTKEPLDDKLPVERPRLLRKGVDLLVDRGTASLSELAAEVGLETEEYTDLTDATRSLSEPQVTLRRPPHSGQSSIVRFPGKRPFTT